HAAEYAFFDGVRRYHERGVLRFHTPGHRGGRWLDTAFRDALGRPAFCYDVSDVLEEHEGPGDWSQALASAERAAARCFGAGSTRFLVNGTTGGIHAALYALAENGGVAFSRASHLAVYA